jgi:hypothetical protein
VRLYSAVWYVLQILGCSKSSDVHF